MSRKYTWEDWQFKTWQEVNDERVTFKWVLFRDVVDGTRKKVTALILREMAKSSKKNGLNKWNRKSKKIKNY